VTKVTLKDGYFN